MSFPSAERIARRIRRQYYRMHGFGDGENCSHNKISVCRCSWHSGRLTRLAGRIGKSGTLRRYEPLHPSRSQQRANIQFEIVFESVDEYINY